MGTTGSRGVNRLSNAAARTARTPGWHADGGGLYLEVDKSGAKRRAMRLVVNGKCRDFGLGRLSKVSLKILRTNPYTTYHSRSGV